MTDTTQNKPTCCELCAESHPAIQEGKWRCLNGNCKCHATTISQEQTDPTQTTPSEESGGAGGGRTYGRGWMPRVGHVVLEKTIDISTPSEKGVTETVRVFSAKELEDVRTAAYEEGVRHGEGTGNGVQRYQMGYAEGHKDGEKLGKLTGNKERKHADCKIHFEDGVEVGRRMGVRDSLEALPPLNEHEPYNPNQLEQGWDNYGHIARKAISTLLK